ncbi:MAG: OmpA family protein [Acidobacteria bacterium]|nr:OmpA family protein [Acidobacteriota bacterium]
MMRDLLSHLLLLVVLGFAIAAPAPSALAESPSGPKQKIHGTIVSMEADNVTLRDSRGAEVAVYFTGDTQVKEKKSNPFRGAKDYAAAQLVSGLEVEVEGRRSATGQFVAEKIRFSDDDLKLAQMIQSQVVPVETRVDEAESRVEQAEGRIGQTEQNAQRLSGQLEELNAVSNAARGGAKAAQETADEARSEASRASQGLSELASGLDQYDAKQSITVHFKAGSALLSPEAKAALDDMAAQTATEKAFVIEVAGFASSDGNEDFNRQLSQRRAEAVTRYLAEEHGVPLRRIVMPFGYGESLPAADNATRQGREQNRRVEVTLLVNRALGQSAPAAGGSSLLDAVLEE